jgi:hypothetical protein
MTQNNSLEATTSSSNQEIPHISSFWIETNYWFRYTEPDKSNPHAFILFL